MVFFYLLTILCLVTSLHGTILDKQSSRILDVLDYGAVGDGKTDDSKAFSKAWETMVAADEDTIILRIPADKTFLLQSISFNGPCKARNVHISVLGNLVLPKRLSWKGKGYPWFSFSMVDRLTIDGPGKIDGRGDTWWPCALKGCARPVIMFFHRCNNLQLKGITFINGPKNHIAIKNTNGASISGLHIVAPESSPNTDGINVGGSTHIDIRDSFIGTGDDCVAINGGSSFINITNLACGPGHGISIGSLGGKGSHDIVEEVHVKKCNFTGTQNGVRIKTYREGSGYAKKITFEQIKFNAARNPIIIDQYYCPSGKCQKEDGGVRVSDITYMGVHGSSAIPEAINLLCSKSVGCTNIVMKDVKIESMDPRKKAYSTCINAHGKSDSTSPNVPCLS